MSVTNPQDWNPGAYARFRGLRLRPALDLLAQVGDLPIGDVVDLGCGDGAVAEALRLRFPVRRLVGVDASASMLAAAQGYDSTVQADIAAWVPDAPVALIFSNAALQWLPDHAALLPRLAACVTPGGVLAVQMPRQQEAASHRLLRDTAQAMFPDRFDFAGWQSPTHPATAYWQMLSPLGDVTAWETEYIQHLAPVPLGHPVRAFTASTAMRPFVERLTRAEAEAFVSAYDTALARAYPVMPDGSALMPFRRTFFILRPTWQP